MRETHFKKFQMFFTDISFRNIKKVSIVKVTLEVRLNDTSHKTEA